MTAVPVTFVTDAQPGGTERYLTLLLDGLGPAWIRDVVCLEDGLADRLRARGYPARTLKTSRRKADILATAWRLRRLVRSSDTGVVHADNLKAALISVLATRGISLPVVWVKHDFSWDGWLARLVGKRCEQVIGVSSSVTRTFDGQGDTNVRVVHNGLPPMQVDREAGRRRLLDLVGPPEPSAIVALVGRLNPLKGHRELLSVIPALRDSAATRFVFLGGDDNSRPEFAAELRREVASAGLGDVVTFLGHQDGAVELIGGCDVVVIPTVCDSAGFGREGFPYVALEALAVGTPVVGYDHGGLPELLGECGLLIPPGDRGALGDSIRRLLDDPDLRDRLGRCGRKRVAEEFSLSATLRSMKTSYREATKSTNGAAT
jgi:glycosyltransferase involved in cell wall biosynthesis